MQLLIFCGPSFDPSKKPPGLLLIDNYILTEALKISKLLVF